MVEILSIRLLWPTEESRKMYANTKEGVDDSYIKNLGVEKVADSMRKISMEQNIYQIN